MKRLEGVKGEGRKESWNESRSEYGVTLGWFPSLYEDELFCSACARFAGVMKYPSQRATLRELCGEASTIALMSLPTGIRAFTEALPPGHTLYGEEGAERLIQEHTLLPYFAAAMPSQRLERLKEDMLGNSRGARGMHMRAGLIPNQLTLPQRFRYCPLCSEEDRRLYGETYWRRAHHLPGVKVCSVHEVCLIDSPTMLRNRTHRLQFVTAEESILSGPPELRRSEPKRADTTGSQESLLVYLARSSSWLLGHRLGTLHAEALAGAYKRLFVERGLASYRGRLNDVGELLRRFTAIYPPHVLEAFGCELHGGVTGNWLLRLVRRGADGSQHPLHHLLLARFLGCSMEELHQLATCSSPSPEQTSVALPFGSPKWLCLNPAAPHYREACIADYNLTYSAQSGLPVAIFACPHCGFTYRRTGPDRSESDRLRTDKALRYGQLWEEKFKVLCADPSVTLREIARHLHIDRASVKAFAARRGLSIEGPRGTVVTRSCDNCKSPAFDIPAQATPACEALENEASKARTRQESGQDANRRKWEMAVLARPVAGVTELRRDMPAVYSWLYRNDRQWLKAHKPPPVRRKQRSPSKRVDWMQRDKELSSAVQEVAERLRMSGEHRKSVTRTAIARALDLEGRLIKQLDKLPLTREALIKVVDPS